MEEMHAGRTPAEEAAQIYAGIERMLAAGELDNAVCALEKFVLANPDSATAHNDLGVLYHRQGRSREALLQYEKAVALAPGNLDMRKNLADFYYVVEHRIEEAIPLYASVIKEIPEDFEALFAMGQISCGFGRNSEARMFLSRALALEPWNETIKSLLAALPQPPAHDLDAVVTTVTRLLKGERPDVDAMLENLHRLVADDKIGEAVSGFEELLGFYPQNALAHNDLGVLYSQAGDWDRALIHHEEAVRLGPENLNFRKNLAELNFAVFGRIDDAIAIYVEIIRDHPNDIETLLALALISRTVGRPEEAKAFYSQVLYLDPNNETAREGISHSSEPAAFEPLLSRGQDNSTAEELYRKAAEFMQQGNTEAAESTLRQLLQRFPDFALAHNDMGVLYSNNGDWKHARQHQEEAVRLQPGNRTFRKNLADLYLTALGRTDDAIAIYVTLQKEDPADIEALLALALISRLIDRPEESKLFYRQVLQLDPTNRIARDAIAPFDSTAAPSPPPRQRIDTAEDCYREACKLMHEGKAEESANLLWQLLGQFPDFAPARNDLGVLAWQAGRRNEAVRHYRQAVQLAPDNITFRKNLADALLVDQENMDEAIALYQEVIRRVPQDAEALFALGTICGRLNRDEEARIFFTKALEADPAMEAARRSLAGIDASPPTEATPAVDDYYSFSRPEIQQLVNPASRRILDVGCAAGMLGAEIKTKLGAEVWGVECVPGAAEAAKRRLDRVLPGFIEDVLPELPDGWFDTIIFADVLEHMVNPGAVLRAIGRKLSDGGELIASIPNVRHWSVLKMLLEGGWKYEDAGILDRSHLRFYTKSGLDVLFAEGGMRLEQLYATTLDGEPEIPRKLISALAAAGLDTATLAEESRHYQYIVKAVPQISARAASTGEDVKGKTACAPAKVTAEAPAATPAPGLVSIIILTMNQLPFTQACAASIERHTPQPHEVIFVDNGSTDGTLAWLEEQAGLHNNYRLVSNSKNLGFARGCNQGIEQAKGEFLLLLNNDVLVTDGWLERMLACLNSSGRIGIVGPMSNNVSGIQLAAESQGLAAEAYPEAAHSFRNKFTGRRIPNWRIVGFCMLFRRSLVDAIGMLDESFGSGNFEDDDFSLRAFLAGYENVIAGDLLVWHHGSATFAGNGVDHSAAMAANRKKFNVKWNPRTLEKATAGRLFSWQAMLEAEELGQAGKVDEAAKVLIEKGIACSPDDPRLYRFLAGMLINEQRFTDALEVLGKGPAGSRDADWHALAGYCREGMDRDDEAEKSAAEALALDAACAPALNLKGVLAFKRDDRKSAGEWFEAACEADPGYGEPCTNLGVMAWAAGEHEKGLGLLKRGFILSPCIADCATRYHAAVTATGIYDEAERSFKDAGRLHPHNRRIALLLTDLLLGQEKFADAMEQTEKAIVAFGCDEMLLDAALSIREKTGLHAPAAGKKAHISLCMIVKDEQPCLARCLANAKPAVDEMIVVDTGSKDRTRDIAIAFGAKVFDFSWNGDFSAARNFSLDQATGKWILVLDADEVISPADYSVLAQLTKGGTKKDAAYSVVTRNYTDMAHAEGWRANDGTYPEEESASGWTPSSKVRLFTRHEHIRFRKPVHEMLEPSLKKAKVAVKECSLVVHHYGKLDERKRTEKDEAYYAAGKAAIETAEPDPAALFELAVQAGELEKYDEALPLWERVIETGHAPALSWFNLGHVHFRMGNFEQSLAASRRALDLEPGMKEAACNYALGELYAGDPAKGIKPLEKVVKAAGDYPLAIATLALLHCCTGKKAQGIKMLRKLREMDFNCRSYLEEHGRRLSAAGKEDLSSRLAECSMTADTDMS